MGEKRSRRVSLLPQASRVKFVFGSESLRVVIGEEEREFDNAFVGGPNEWKYSAFTNWEFWWDTRDCVSGFRGSGCCAG